MPRQERFQFTVDELLPNEAQRDLAEARAKIRRAQKKTDGCSEECQDLLIGHSEDCPNRNRYDVV